jgi:hypothetical protein
MKAFHLICPVGALIAALASAQAPAVPKSPAGYGQGVDRSGKFKPGDMAPDFSLKVMHKETRVTLAGFRGQRPVALVFGSYT